ncbi:MAG TPA: arsenate reductase ArsC [Anaerolineales bacterium]|nr:arsenate reductase ArsC [Anaerolineales bacterium]
MTQPTRVLVLCSGNSCRSQMAEGWFNRLAEGRVLAFSAGVSPAGFVHPLAIRAMAEVGIDISGQRSKPMDEFLEQPFDLVITVCAPAAEACPVFPGRAQRLHWPFDDPAAARGDETARMAAFRRVRDEVQAAIQAFLASHAPAPSNGS